MTNHPTELADYYHYWIFSPARDFTDDKNNLPAFEKSISWKGKVYLWSIFTDAAGHPLAARLLVENSPNSELPSDLLPLATLLINHTISVLRVIWAEEVSLLKMRFATARKDGGASIELSMSGNPPLNANLAAQVFTHTMPIREVFGLFSDGNNELIPLRYRFLSLYKILELQFRNENDQWDNENLKEALDFQRLQYNNLGINIPFESELHNLRDRCAHIKTGKAKKRRMGVTSLSHDAAIEVERMMPLLKEVCGNIINKLAAGNMFVQINDTTPRVLNR